MHVAAGVDHVYSGIEYDASDSQHEVQDIVIWLSYENEYRCYIENLDGYRTYGNVFEILYSGVEPLYQECSENNLGGTGPEELGILTELRDCTDANGVHSHHSQREKQVHAKYPRKDRVKFVPVSSVRSYLSYSQDRYAHSGEEQEVVYRIVDEVDQSQFLHTQDPRNIGERNQPYNISGYCKYALVYEVGLD